MWTRVPHQLARIIALLEEQTQILRSLGGPAPIGGARWRTPNTVTRLRGASDVWQRTPLTENVFNARDRSEREAAASPPSAGVSGSPSPDAGDDPV